MTQSIQSTVSPIQITRDVFLIKKEDSWKITAAKIALWVSCAFGVGLLVAIATLFADLYKNVSGRSTLDKKTIVELTDLDPPAKLPELLEERETDAPAQSKPTQEPAPATIATLPPATEEPAPAAPQATIVEKKSEEPVVIAATPAPKAGYRITGRKIAIVALAAAAGYMAYQYGANAAMYRGVVQLPEPTCPVGSRPIPANCTVFDAPTQLIALPSQANQPICSVSNAPARLPEFSDFIAAIKPQKLPAAVSPNTQQLAIIAHTATTTPAIYPTCRPSDRPLSDLIFTNISNFVSGAQKWSTSFFAAPKARMITPGDQLMIEQSQSLDSTNATCQSTDRHMIDIVAESARNLATQAKNRGVALATSAQSLAERVTTNVSGYLRSSFSKPCEYQRPSIQENSLPFSLPPAPDTAVCLKSEEPRAYTIARQARATAKALENQTRDAWKGCEGKMLSECGPNSR